MTMTVGQLMEAAHALVILADMVPKKHRRAAEEARRIACDLHRFCQAAVVAAQLERQCDR